jgi:N6-adenosine-specific RNA methylase IME4
LAKAKERQLMAESKGKKIYSTILADPAWKYDQLGNYGACRHYPVLDFEKILKIPVADLAAPNAHLYLWVTNGVLPYGLEILKAWGFQYRSIFTWVKPKLGLGNYIRNSTEQVLFATRGKAPVLYKAQPSWGFFPVQDHSHKPEEFHKIIERLSPGPYLELFARRRPPGEWDVWGNDESIQSDIDIPGYPVPNLKKEAK